jgi:hypothetical protein
MSSTLHNGFMGTEESLFTILLYQDTENYEYYPILGNGLLSKFFEDLKNKETKALKEKVRVKGRKSSLNLENTALYILTFNSPKQLETLFRSMLYYDGDFLSKPDIFVIDNSVDESTFEEYQKICNDNNVTHLKMSENLGVCGGRQYVSEHAKDADYDYYFFFEDDMFFYTKVDSVCRNGFPRFHKKLYQTVLEIATKEDFDFIKLSFSEFYGDNSTQWSWYNVPQDVREKVWPEYNKLPKVGLDPNAPKTRYNNIMSHKGLSYANGEIYYSNWPQLVSKTGNQKMFLDTTWVHPYEQTWMSYMFQETIEGNLNPGILLLSPTEHDRFDHYDGKLRKES